MLVYGRGLHADAALTKKGCMLHGHKCNHLHAHTLQAQGDPEELDDPDPDDGEAGDTAVIPRVPAPGLSRRQQSRQSDAYAVGGGHVEPHVSNSA